MVQISSNTFQLRSGTSRRTNMMTEFGKRCNRIVTRSSLRRARNSKGMGRLSTRQLELEIQCLVNILYFIHSTVQILNAVGASITSSIHKEINSFDRLSSKASKQYESSVISLSSSCYQGCLTLLKLFLQ